MTAPSGGYVRLTAGGDIATTQSWSTGFTVSVPGSATSQSDLQTLLGAFRAAWEIGWATATTTKIASINAADTRLYRYRAYLYAPSGGPAILQASEDRTALLGTQTGSSVPTQTSIVATLLSGLPGRSYRGRMYLPATAITLGATHQTTQTVVNGLATTVAGIITAVNAATTGTPFGEVVVAGLQGRIPISSVRVDSEPDIQRRRADKVSPLFYGNANV